MPRNILITANSFKGTLSSQRVAHIIAQSWETIHPHDKVRAIPLSDGGESFARSLSAHIKSTKHSTQIRQTSDKKYRVYWYKCINKNIALVDVASLLGLNKYSNISPFERDSFALGEFLIKISRHPLKQIVIGLGGSGTNDGGFGLARALGWRFLNKRGQEIRQWFKLNHLHKINSPAVRTKLPPLLAAADVRNPLIGPDGCTKIFGPQKGLTKSEIIHAEKALKRLAHVVERNSEHDIKDLAHAGAAGGLGFGLRAFCRAELSSGFDYFAQKINLSKHVMNADLIICAEGTLDPTSFMGKSTGEVARHAKKGGTPCIALCGQHKKSRDNYSFFKIVGALEEITSRENAFQHTTFWLKKLTQKVAKQL